VSLFLEPGSRMKISGVEQTKSRAFICPWCGRPAVATIRGAATWDNTKSDDPTIVEYTLVQCSECGDASLESREDFGAGFKEDDPVFVYPARRRLSDTIPRRLRSEFDEAQECFSVKAYEATALMVRRILEGVCKENNIQERTLFKGLEELQKNGLIDGTISEWATELRLLGNEGAHYTGDRVPRDDAEDALAFAEALLDHIYVLRKRFTDFTNRRADKKASKAAKS